jgi:hypothetical protein
MSDEALKPLHANNLGTFFHGCAHMYLAFRETSGNLSPSQRYTDNMGLLKVFVGLGLFWYGFMRGIFDDGPEYVRIASALFFNCIHIFLVPGKFGFSYVALALTLCYTSKALFGEKGKYYNALSICLAWTGTFQLWAEGLACDQFMVNYGGHLLYDMSIPIGYLIFFTYARHVEKADKSIKVE